MSKEQLKEHSQEHTKEKNIFNDLDPFDISDLQDFSNWRK